MNQHILLLFLSDVKTRLVDNKAVIQQAKYRNIMMDDNADECYTHTTNESAIRYLLSHIGSEKLTRIFVLASQKVQSEYIYARNNNNEHVPYYDDDGAQCTHLAYFRKRMSQFLPIDTCMPEDVICNYNEKASLPEILMNVAEVAGKIQDYAKEISKESGDRVILHVDLTGGMRPTNMMMLDIIRLLEYSGIEIGHLLYSKYDSYTRTGIVEELQNIYELFQLISGAEEFVHFGSAKALRKYYDSKSPSSSLDSLLNAMEKFAEEIKLCHYGQLRAAIIRLHDAVNSFSSENENSEDLLMERLIDRIRKEYKELIELRDLDDLRVIRWCLKNGYMQQALTLCTERLPEYMGEHGLLLQTTDESNKLDILTEDDSMGRNRWFILLNAYPFEKEDASKYYKNYTKLLKDAFSDMQKKKFSYEELSEKLSTFFSEHNLTCEDSIKLEQQMHLLNDIFCNPALMLEPFQDKLLPLKPIFSEIDFGDIDRGYLKCKKVNEFLKNLKLNNFKKLFPMPCINDPLEIKYPYTKQIHQMIAKKIFSSTISEDAFLSIMNKYYRLKEERNHSNHAHDKDGNFATADELRIFMEKCIYELEAVCIEKN